jgi:hypothetical protein
VPSSLFLPSTLLVTIGFQAFLALVLVHLKATFLFEITHVRTELDLVDLVERKVS